MIHNADLTCRQAEAFMVVVLNFPSEFHIGTERPGEEEIRCRVYPESSSSVSARCRVGSGEVELVG